jgi:hypothetical protein
MRCDTQEISHHAVLRRSCLTPFEEWTLAEVGGAARPYRSVGRPLAKKPPKMLIGPLVFAHFV